MNQRQLPKALIPSALIVEPVPALARFLTALMTDLGFRVSTVAQPDDALDHLEASTQPVDLIISEFALPYITGARLARFIRRRIPNAPIILLCDEPVNERFQRPIGAHLLCKPFTREQLAALLRNAQLLAA